MRIWQRISLALMFVFSAFPALAEEAGQVAASGGDGWKYLKYLGAGIAIGLAVIGGGTGQGKAAAAAFEGIGRNPQATDKMFTPLLIGLALIEFQTIMAFIIAILMFFL